MDEIAPWMISRIASDLEPNSQMTNGEARYPPPSKTRTSYSRLASLLSRSASLKDAWLDSRFQLARPYTKALRAECGLPATFAAENARSWAHGAGLIITDDAIVDLDESVVGRLCYRPLELTCSITVVLGNHDISDVRPLPDQKFDRKAVNQSVDFDGNVSRRLVPP